MYNVSLPGEKHLNSASAQRSIIINIFTFMVIIINSASIRFCSVAPRIYDDI